MTTKNVFTRFEKMQNTVISLVNLTFKVAAWPLISLLFIKAEIKHSSRPSYLL
jgi:hypothetical protein